MSYDPPSFSEFRTDMLAEYRNQIAGADVSEDAEIYARASMVAAGLALMSEGLTWLEDQIFPDSADTANLERHASVYGLSRKQPTASSGGVVLFTGTDGTTIPSATTFTHADGTQFQTTAEGEIVDGEAEVDAEAVTTGSVGNKVADDTMTVDAPISGLDSVVTVVTAFSGGTDEETDAALAARVLARMRNGAAGGTRADYEAWALEVDGVVAADALPLRRGLGTISVAVYSLGGDGYREPATEELRDTVLAYLQERRPLTADVDVPVVSEITATVFVQILEIEEDYDEAEVLSAVEAAIRAYIWTLTTGEDLYRSRLGATISRVGGVIDYNLVHPDENKVAIIGLSNVQVFTPPTTVTVVGPTWEPEV